LSSKNGPILDGIIKFELVLEADFYGQFCTFSSLSDFASFSIEVNPMKPDPVRPNAPPQQMKTYG
jgi:hypothetical protein